MNPQALESLVARAESLLLRLEQWLPQPAAAPDWQASTAFRWRKRSGTGVLKVDGQEVARSTMERSIPITLQWDESFDVGADTLTGVDDRDYQPPFAFDGTIDALTIRIDRPQLSPEEIRKLEAAQGGSNRTSE